MSLQGKVAIVTGSSMGLGQAVAEELAVQGVRVAVNSRSQERADRIAGAIAGRGGECIAVAADVGTRQGNQALVDAAVARWGRLDIMINNAGISRNARSLDLDEAEWMEHIQLNLNGLFFGCQAAARQMVRQGSGGVILNLGSVYSHVGNRFRAAYIASKHGVSGLTKALAAEWAQYKIRVVEVCPAYIRTPMVDTDLGSAVSDPELFFTDADIQRRTPLARFGVPDEVSKVVAFLVSDAASYMTGTSVNVDGGWVGHGGW